MNKKGFTLIELIGVIVILSILLLIIVPNITGSTQRGIEAATKQSEESAEMAAKLWGTEHLGSMPKNNGETKNVTIDTLVNDGYFDINKEGKLPNGKKLTGCVQIKNTKPSKKKKKTYTYTYKASC